MAIQPNLINGEISLGVRPLLFAIYVAPLFYLTDLLNFADDSFTLAIAKNKDQAIQIITEKLTLITKWLKDSSLSVNDESKTEVCVFYHKNTPKIEIILNNVIYYQIKRYDESFKSII